MDRVEATGTKHTTGFYDEYYETTKDDREITRVSKIGDFYKIRGSQRDDTSYTTFAISKIVVFCGGRNMEVDRYSTKSDVEEACKKLKEMTKEDYVKSKFP